MDCVRAIILALALIASYAHCVASDNIQASTIATSAADLSQVDSTRLSRFSLKTNALGYPLLISNIAVEIDVCPHMSVAVPVYFSALNYFRETVKFRTFTVQPELRVWLRTDSVQHTGWFVGPHVGMGFFNVATNSSLRRQDHDGHSPALGAGVGVGYRMSLGQSRRWFMEFTAGVGVYALHYDYFRNEHNGMLVKTTRRTYAGPDMLAVNIVYRLGKKKGGHQ